MQIKAEKIVANAKEEAVRMKAHAKEECEKAIATSHTEAERVWLKTSNSFALFNGLEYILLQRTNIIVDLVQSLLE